MSFDLPPIHGKSWRVQKRLLAANFKTLLMGRGFSGAENLLHLLSKHDGYLYAVSLLPPELTARQIRRSQRDVAARNLASLSVDEIAIHAQSEAEMLSHKTLAIEHLLLAILRYDPRSAALLEQHGVNYEKAKDMVLTRGIAGYERNFGFKMTFYGARSK